MLPKLGHPFPVFHRKLAILLSFCWAEYKRNYRSFVVGLLTVFLVVAFLTFIRNALIRSSLVFVKLSEATVRWSTESKVLAFNFIFYFSSKYKHKFT
jgi:hypothetical protein